MKKPYHNLSGEVFGNKKQLSMPHKRPQQARSRFTVDAVYGALVRILESGNWSNVSMRRLSEESGYAVGTLYEYFPNKFAVLSGYVRSAIEARLELMTTITETDWQNRVKKAIQIMLGLGVDVPILFPRLMQLEYKIAAKGQHERVFREFITAWTGILGADPALTDISASDIEIVVLLSWGSWRYSALLGPKVMQDEVLSNYLCSIIIDHLDSG